MFLMSDGMVLSSTQRLTCASVIGSARRVHFYWSFLLVGMYSQIGSGEYSAKQYCLCRCGLWVLERGQCFLAYWLCD